MSKQEEVSLAALADQLVGCSPLVREPLGAPQAGELARVFKAMGDPVRLRLLSLIASHAGGEACVCDLTGVVAKLSTLDRFLPVWILAAMVLGPAAGRLIPGLGQVLGAIAVDGVSLPIALGLLIMMYPVLAKVRYDRLDTVTGDRRLLVSSLILNWVLGPALMFA